MEQYLTLDEQIVALCAELCGRYPFSAVDYQARIAAAIAAMRPLVDEEQQAQLDNLLADAIEDTRIGRSNAEIDDFIRDAKQRRTAAAAQQNADDCKHTDGDL